MGNKQVQILMKTLRQEQGQQEKAEYEYAGYWGCLDAAYYLTYEEMTDKAPQMQERIRTLITYTGDSLVVKRKGACEQRMEFFVGSRTKALYETAAGRLPMEVETQEIQLEIGEKKHKIHLDYRLFSSGISMGEYRMELEILF